MNDAKILLIVAFEGFHHIEYGEPKRILEDAGFNIVTASNKPGMAIAKDGSTTEVNVILDKVNVSQYTGIFFIGGPGAMENLDTPTSYRIAKEAVKQNMPIGAICISTRILAKASVLTGKRATGWNGDGQLGTIYEDLGVEYVAKEDIVVDDAIITATGPAVAKEFGERIVALLQDKQGWG